MREIIVDFIKQLKLKQFQTTSELPFSNSGTVLYLKNPKKIYVDQVQTQMDEFVPVFSGTIDTRVDSVSVYFANDAKQLPTEYSTLVEQLKQAKDQFEIDPKYFRKTVSITTQYENDLLITQVEYTFTKLA